jgi:chitinase
MHELALLRSKGYTYNVICLAFAKPDANYVRESFVDTGLEFNSDFAVVRDAIAMLKQQSSSSSTVVLLSVGGATYRNWNNLDVKSLHALVDDLGADGIDIDLEDQTMRHELGGIISRLRNEFPTGEYFLSLAAFSVGAYGHGEYQDAPPASPNTGMCVPGLQQSGAMLDAIFGMFYDASNAFDPCVAFQAYRQLFHHGPIAMGVEVPPEAWGGHTVTIHKIESYAHHVLREDPNGLSGLMVWSHHKAGYPSARDVVDVALRHFS